MTRQTLTLSVWKCNKTEQEFQTYGLGGPGSYGEFLMHAQNGAMAYWNTLDDPVYKSLVSITDAFAADLSLNRLTVFYLTCGICCDAASDGSVYSRRPFCLCCKANDVTFFFMPEPLQLKAFVLPDVTHKRWKRLSEEGRKELVRNEMTRVGLI